MSLESEVKTTENGSKGQKLDVLCMNCKRETKHDVLLSIDQDGKAWDREEGWDVSWQEMYQTIQCRGCENITFRHASWFSEDDPYEGPTERLYPQRTEETATAKPFRNLPTSLRRIYNEVIDCFNGENYTLCAAGLRAIVEGLCADQKITDGPVTVPAKGGGTQVVRKDNLEGKISGLQEKGILTSLSANTLHEHRYLGNDAVHELRQPSADELRLAIEILEHTLEQLYEIPEKASLLKQKAAASKK